jgi:hypothetical protein
MDLLGVRIDYQNDGRDRTPECRPHYATGSWHQAFSNPADFHAKGFGATRGKIATIVLHAGQCYKSYMVIISLSLKSIRRVR